MTVLPKPAVSCRAFIAASDSSSPRTCRARRRCRSPPNLDTNSGSALQKRRKSGSVCLGRGSFGKSRLNGFFLDFGGGCAYRSLEQSIELLLIAIGRQTARLKRLVGYALYI